MAAPPSNVSRHPFHSRERVNFPEFSPIFSKHVTPESSQVLGQLFHAQPEQLRRISASVHALLFFLPFASSRAPAHQRGFHWSIDHIARLKPADIDTDPFTLVKTNGHSPDSDEERQQASDIFFSQRSILPSPWPTGQTKTSARCTPATLPTSHMLSQYSLTPGHTKKVTFSPHPPSTAYISSDSLDSEQRETALVNAGTQTAVTIPLAYNLSEILGSACTYCSEDMVGGVRDLANSSLRRKLFGQPSMITDEGEEEEEEEEEGGRGGEGEEEEGRGMGGSPAQSTRIHTYVTPSKCLSSDRHLSSTPLNQHPSHPHHQHSSHTHTPSPHIILRGGDSNTNPTASSYVLTPGGNSPKLSPIEGAMEGGVASIARSKDACKRLFLTTPKKQSMYSTHLTPSPLPTCPPFSPILSHHLSEGVRGDCEGVRGAGDEHVTAPIPAVTKPVGSATKATSTPYPHSPQMQLVGSSHYVSRDVADPHLERERSVGTAGLENGERGREEGEGGWWKDGERRGEPREGENRELVNKEKENEGSEDLPQPLTMADLQTFEDDLTSVTGVTTCTSYFNQLATDDGDSHTTNERQPLHSTVAIPNSAWNPSIATVEPQVGAAYLRLPSIREISRINAPSMSVTDSGVAASSDFNQPTGGSLTQLTNIGGAGRGALHSINHAAPTDLEHEKLPENKQMEKVPSEIEKGHIGRRSGDGCVDSGLVASPDQDREIDERGPREMGGVSTARQPLNEHSTPRGNRLHSNLPAHSSTSITPSRYSTIRNRLGVPLAFTQKSVFANNRAFLRGNILPSHLKLTPALPLSSPGLPSHRASSTPTRHTSSSNWFGGLLTAQSGLTSPIFPEEVVRRKEALKARLQFCSPVRSRSPLSANRRPLVDTLNLPSPVTTFTKLPLSPFTPSHAHTSPLPLPPSFSPLPSCTTECRNGCFPPSPFSLPFSPQYIPQREVRVSTWQQNILYH